MKKALLIINPISGVKSKAGLKETVTARLAKEGIEVATVYTERGGHASELALSAVSKGFGMVVSAGGDGTVNEIANAISHTPLTLGILPFGSGNGLSRSLGIPQDLDGALNVIASGNKCLCDRGMAGGNPFYCTFGVGFDAAVSEKFANDKRRGKATYIKNVLLEFLKYRSKPYAISVNGKVVVDKAFLITVCNATQYGNNAYIAPQAKLDDGMLDIVVVHEGNPLQTVKLGVDLMAGYMDKNRRIDSFRAPHATITRLDDDPVHVDGEPRNMGRNIRIECDPAALAVFAPPREDFKPLVSPIKSMIADIRSDVIDTLR